MPTTIIRYQDQDDTEAGVNIKFAKGGGTDGQIDGQTKNAHIPTTIICDMCQIIKLMTTNKSPLP